MKNALFTMIICMTAISFAWAQERPSMIENRNYTEKLDSVVEYQGEKKGIINTLIFITIPNMAVCNK